MAGPPCERGDESGGRLPAARSFERLLRERLGHRGARHPCELLTVSDPHRDAHLGDRSRTQCGHRLLVGRTERLESLEDR